MDDPITVNLVISYLERMTEALESLAENARKLANPTDEEVKEKLEKSMTLALLLGMGRGDNDPLN